MHKWPHLHFLYYSRNLILDILIIQSRQKQLAMISNESGFDELWISGLDGIKKTAAYTVKADH